MSENRALSNSEKKNWKPFELNYVGILSETVLVGGGKLSATGGDPGEPRKPRPSG